MGRLPPHHRHHSGTGDNPAQRHPEDHAALPVFDYRKIHPCGSGTNAASRQFPARAAAKRTVIETVTDKNYSPFFTPNRHKQTYERKQGGVKSRFFGVEKSRFSHQIKRKAGFWRSERDLNYCNTVNVSKY